MIWKKTIPVVPIGKPRMTRADKWKKRPCVLLYRAFADEMRLRCKPYPGDPLTVNWTAYFPIPKSWSKKKKAEMEGMPHRQKPDRDNIDKAILDSLFGEDSVVAFGALEKYWDDGGGARIDLEIIPADDYDYCHCGEPLYDFETGRGQCISCEGGVTEAPESAGIERKCPTCALACKKLIVAFAPIVNCPECKGTGEIERSGSGNVEVLASEERGL